MNTKSLREEILGANGYAKWLKEKGVFVFGEQLAQKAQEYVRQEMGEDVSCANVNAYLNRLLDAEYEIYLLPRLKQLWEDTS